VPLFSIVIPTYNTQKFLKACINSVLKQKFKNYEIILIDDCSTDDSKKICRSYRYIDKLKVFRNKKQIGPGLSRNKGILLSKGKYIVFLDSDDLLEKNSLEELSKFIIKNNHKDVFITKYNSDKPPYSNNFFFNQNFINKKDLILKINKNDYQTNVCWHYVINKKFIEKNKIKFKYFKIFEDQEFIMQVLSKMSSFSLYKKDFYWHRARKNSLSQSIDLETTKSLLLLILEISRFIKMKKFPNYIKIFLLRQLKNAIEQFSFRLVLHQNKSEILQIKDYSKKINFNKNIEYLNNFFKIKLKLTSYKEFSNFRNYIIDNILKNTNLIKKDKIYVYCAYVYGLALTQELKKRKFKVECILDDNVKFSTNLSKKFKMKVKSPKNIFKINSISKDKYKILVCARSDIIYQKILKSLIGLNVSKKNILNMSNPFV
jgi:teichuronic acid biosynthesis glycosyltransferase TuaG